MTIADQLKDAASQALLTVTQFSLLTQLSERTVYRLIAQGRLDIVRIGPTTIRIPRSAIRVGREQHHAAQQAALQA
jgi:excisionase family DNA binding protein